MRGLSDGTDLSDKSDKRAGQRGWAKPLTTDH
nr:MAG TPA: hypothetical protein [Caudoviricetes sp.]